MTSLPRTARSLVKRPAYSALSILLLSLGVGAVGTIFTVVDVAMLRPLPYAHADRLQWISALQPAPRGGETPGGLVASQLSLWRANTRLFDGVEGAISKIATLTVNTEPEPVQVFQCSAGMLPLLGVAPVLGRGFTRADEVPGSTVILVSYSFWQRKLAGDQKAIGRTVNVDGLPFTIIGVTPRGFTPLFLKADIYAPLPLDASQMQNTWRGIMSVGLLKPGVRVSDAAGDLDRSNAEVAATLPQLRGSHASVEPLREALFGGDRDTLLIMLAAVSLLLMIAVANMMNLALSDSLARRQTTMTLLALGASRFAVVARRISEAALLAVVSAVIGLGITKVALTGLQSVNPSFFAGFGVLELNARLGVALLGASVFAGIVAALPAAIADSRVSIASIAGAAAKSIGGRKERLVRELLLSAQVAVALVLLFAAALLARNLRGLMNVDRGFDASHLVAVRLSIPPRYGTPDERSDYLGRLASALETLPGVSQASASQVTFATGQSAKAALAIEGASSEANAGLFGQVRHVLPGAFSVMKVRLVQGRLFDANDREGRQPVSLVSASFAKQFLPSGRAIGSRIRRTAVPGAPWTDVVGIVQDVKDAGVAEDLGPTIYLPYRQDNQTTVIMSLIARYTSAVPPTEQAVKAAIWKVDASQSITRVTSVETLAHESAAQPRFQALVVTLLGVGSLILISGGIYALTLFMVLARTREIALRSALGAEPASLVANAIREGLRPVVIGVIAGLVVAVPSMRLMQRLVSQEFQIADLPGLLMVLAGLLAVTTIAAAVPARRAIRVSPIDALRA